MPALNQRLADALSELKALQDQGKTGIPSSDLSRAAREILVKQGFLQPVMKGWYAPSRPDVASGDSTPWYAAFWDFARDYLNARFGSDWVLGPEQSVVMHAGDTTVPAQVLVRSPKAGNRPTMLLHGTGLYDMKSAMPDAADIQVVNGIRLVALEPALVSAGPALFEQSALEARTALASLRDVGNLNRRLIAGGHATIAGRLAGALRDIGRDREANEVLAAMRAAGYDVRETNPFPSPGPRVPLSRDPSPYVHRLRLLWDAMRGVAIERFPLASGPAMTPAAYLAQVDERYVSDAYHSLSIEGFQVSADLIERVRIGGWRPDRNPGDGAMEAALAARGYWLCFQAVKTSVQRVLAGADPGEVADEDHGAWYRALYEPRVAAGVFKPEDLAGYRNGQVFLRGSRHVPPNPDAVRDAMPAFFDLLRAEEDARVRIVLGHFFYVHIHPYVDGNGRTGRFLMNVMAAAGGYPWIIVPVQRRNEYMAALEAASVAHDIGPFTDFIAGLVGAPTPRAG